MSICWVTKLPAFTFMQAFYASLYLDKMPPSPSADCVLLPVVAANVYGIWKQTSAILKSVVSLSLSTLGGLLVIFWLLDQRFEKTQEKNVFLWFFILMDFLVMMKLRKIIFESLFCKKNIKMAYCWLIWIKLKWP